MTSPTISGLDAWLAFTERPDAKWNRARKRFAEPVFPLAHEPKFTIDPAAKFFCIGSCFARNIEEHLIYGGLDVISKRIVAPAAEWPQRTTGLVNKFTSASILNELAWIGRPPDFSDPNLFVESDEGWIDLQLAPGVRPVPFARAVERRAYLTENYFTRLLQADVVVITLGLIEAWLDLHMGVHLNAPPPVASVRRQPDRYVLDVTTVQSNVEALEAIRAELKALNPACRIIVTVSPVPLSATYSGVDVVRANTLSKAVLRVAANVLSQAHDDVDYFPRYEIVTHSPRESAYAEDKRHVSDAIVGVVTSFFATTYIGEIAPLDPAYREVPYLAANPDVETAVRSGLLASGLKHWLDTGRTDGRCLSPESPTALMKTTGIV